MVYLNTIPIRSLSHRIKNGNRENRQPVEPKSVKQHKATEMKLWGAIVQGTIFLGVVMIFCFVIVLDIDSLDRVVITVH
jgi:hypothetical protein